MIQILITLVLFLCVSCITNDEDIFTRSDLLRALYIPQYKRLLETKIERSWVERDVVFENVSFNGRHDERINAIVSYSLLAKFQPGPALILMSGSTNKKEDFYNNLNFLRDWADKGFFIISIDRPTLFKLNTPEPEDILRTWGRPVYDLTRTVDFIISRAEADSEKIGMLGISLGSMEALWLAALDDRIDAVVAVSGHLVWPDVFQSGSWRRIFSRFTFFKQHISRGTSNLNAMNSFFNEYSDIAVVDASNVIRMWKPIPLFIIAGENDPYNSESSARSLCRAAKNAYGDFAYNIDFKIYDGAGHNFVHKMEEDALKWLERKLF